MEVLYDFKEDFETVEPGNFKNNDIISLRSSPPSSAVVHEVEDVKTLHITQRTARECGIYININKIPDILAGDRITVTGRIGDGEPLGRSWSVALLSVTDGHLTQHIKPVDVFALSHILEEKELEQVFTVHTIGWGVKQPLMDFYIDSIVISRRKRETEDADTRTVVYSLADEPQLYRISLPEEENQGIGMVLVRSGNSKLSIIEHDGKEAIQVGNRVNDWDGIDMNLSYLKLHYASQYKITVHGSIQSNAPAGSTIMLQGVPNYDWRSITPIEKGAAFTLEYIMSRTDVEKWTSVRVTTNTIGSSVTFNIYSLEVTRVE